MPYAAFDRPGLAGTAQAVADTWDLTVRDGLADVPRYGICNPSSLAIWRDGQALIYTRPQEVANNG